MAKIGIKYQAHFINNSGKSDDTIHIFTNDDNSYLISSYFTNTIMNTNSLGINMGDGHVLTAYEHLLLKKFILDMQTILCIIEAYNAEIKIYEKNGNTLIAEDLKHLQEKYKKEFADKNTLTSS